MKTLAKPDFETLIDGLIDDEPRSVVGPQRRNGQYVFEELDSAGDLALEYDLTVRERGRTTRLVQSDGGTGQ
ncbi:hypothetical protein [Halapricum desulfuricans]|uniref:Ferredoxin n=1 Tax=Halapricum desulfuricans TaxID=2841257 RepID=A0A897NT78_9EURY|nr:hypothetical protein [Halapricum desulfuricans]QSG13969.1 Ferredoxin [Halapricum desulfuricans]